LVAKARKQPKKKRRVTKPKTTVKRRDAAAAALADARYRRQGLYAEGRAGTARGRK
jgi:hypothetical protein